MTRWSDIPLHWLVLGLGGQLLFFGRFLIQWIASERRKQSVMPTVFWWFSIGGSLCVLNYAIFWLGDPVIILGQSVGIIVYTRNLMLIRRKPGVAEQKANA